MTLCHGVECPIRKDCSRYQATPEYNRFWYYESPYNKDSMKCRMFVKNEKK